MASDVPFLTKQSIEGEAALLLAEYGRDHVQVTQPPVPVDDIVELQLKLTLELKDLRQLFGFGDVHGAIWFRSKKVGIDQSLDPRQNPAQTGPLPFHTRARSGALAAASSS